MNVERIDQCIEMMRRANRLHMTYYQSNGKNVGEPYVRIARTIEELHECGNAACFAGYLAISPEFRDAGGSVNCGYGGAPLFNGQAAASAVSAYLEISVAAGRSLVYGRLYPEGASGVRPYPVDFAAVKPEHVIAFLTRIRDREII